MLTVVSGGCVFLVSGVTGAGVPVTKVEELHVSVTEGVTEWRVVSDVDMGTAETMRWAPGLCLEDICSSERSTTVTSPIGLGQTSDISNLMRSLNHIEKQLSGVISTTATTLEVSIEGNIESQSAETTGKSESRNHSNATSSSPSPTLIFSLGPGAAGQDTLIFSGKPEHEYVTTTSSSTLFSDHKLTDIE